VADQRARQLSAQTLGGGVSRFDATWYRQRSVGGFAFGSLLSAAFAFFLVYVHTLFACLVIPLAYSAGFVACDVVSQIGFGRPFHPPSKFGTPEEDRVVGWSDWIFHAITILVTILALFAMGNFADSVRGENVWKW
jgi:hypothetical protein